jgi:hypothetical protein
MGWHVIREGDSMGLGTYEFEWKKEWKLSF